MGFRFALCLCFNLVVGDCSVLNFAFECLVGEILMAGKLRLKNISPSLELLFFLSFNGKYFFFPAIIPCVYYTIS